MPPACLNPAEGAGTGEKASIKSVLLAVVDSSSIVQIFLVTASRGKSSQSTEYMPVRWVDLRPGTWLWPTRVRCRSFWGCECSAADNSDKRVLAENAHPVAGVIATKVEEWSI